MGSRSCLTPQQRSTDLYAPRNAATVRSMVKATYRQVTRGLSGLLAVLTLSLVMCSSSSEKGATNIACSGGTQGASCSGYPDGDVCPGPGLTCTQCAPGVYAPASGVCICQSGVWECGGPLDGGVNCIGSVPGTAQLYSDPSCTIPWTGDAGSDAAPGAETGTTPTEGGADATGDASSIGYDGAMSAVADSAIE